MKAGKCSSLFLLSPVLVLWGLSILITSLGTLGFTSSFFQVFPLGSPLWCGSMFLILGLFVLATYNPSKIQLLDSSGKLQIVFTLMVSILATLYCLLSIGISIWYREVIGSSFSSCFSGSSSHLVLNCECAHGFTNPPSLHLTIHHFMGVSDCGSLGKRITIFHWILLALYSMGTLLAVTAGGLSMKRLHGFGLCGKSGVYAITPEHNTPTLPDSASISHQMVPNTCSSHDAGHALTGLFQSKSPVPAITNFSTASSLHNYSPIRSRLRSTSFISSSAQTVV